MTKHFLTFIFFFSVLESFSQSAEETIDSLQNENAKVVKTPCEGGKGMIITDRALNVFFADKIGSYLSEGGDLSLFENYATLSTSDGKFTINHNFIGKGERIRNLVTIGAKANIADGFASVFNGKKINNELGLTVKYTYIGSGSIFFDQCKQVNAIYVPSKHKDGMDAVRAYLLETMALEIISKAKDIDAASEQLESKYFGNTHIQVDSVKDTVRKKEYQKLTEEYIEKFAKDQAKKITALKNYTLITTHWISISAYIPITSQKFSVANSFATNFQNERTYPWEASFSLNKIWEHSTLGRLFGNLTIGIAGNNSVKTEDVDKTNLRDYKNLGGADTLHFAELSSDEAYVGNFSEFTTPLLKGQLVYFPRKWNVGLSILAEQNFGKYNPLNLKVGVPIRLNDKDGDPTVNFEVQARFSDVSNNIMPDKKVSEKVSIGITVGLPFSSIIY